jgi:hypothetical protein
MKICSRWLILSFSLLICAFYITACDKKPTVEGKLVVSEKEYILSQFSDNGWSCIDVWVPAKWFKYSQNSDIVSSEQEDVVEKIGYGQEADSKFDQKDIISYIAVGNEEAFSFKEFAYFYTQSPDQKPELPPEEELDIIIESFLTVEQ